MALFRVSFRDALNFHIGTEWESDDRDAGASRIRLGELRLVDLVHRGEVAHIRQINIDLDDIVRGDTGSLHDIEEIAEGLHRLGSDIALLIIGRGGIHRRLTGEEDIIAAVDGVGIRAGRDSALGIIGFLLIDSSLG